jgi:hypothetical protein
MGLITFHHLFGRGWTSLVIVVAAFLHVQILKSRGQFFKQLTSAAKHVDPASKCREWNATKPLHSSISKADFRILFYRHVPNRVARWYIFMPKLPIRVYFSGPWNINCWYILSYFRIFNDHLALWYILSRLVYAFSFWYVLQIKIWQP